MEFMGMDLIKHGEAAYPAEAWVEVQYGARKMTQNGIKPPSSSNLNGLPPHMNNHANDVHYNNPDALFPHASKLMNQVSIFN